MHYVIECPQCGYAWEEDEYAQDVRMIDYFFHTAVESGVYIPREVNCSKCCLRLFPSRKQNESARKTVGREVW